MRPNRLSEDTPVHVTRRLLIVPIGAGRSFVFCPLSGSLDIADDSEIAMLESLQRGERAHIPAAELKHLAEHKIVFESSEAEEQYLERIVTEAWQRMDATLPPVYTICPTLACNLNCPYCFEGDSLAEKKQGVMTEAQVTRVFDAIGQLEEFRAARNQENGGRSNGQDSFPPVVTLFGGEPLLPSTRSCVSSIFERAADQGFLLAATTNGVNVSRFQDALTTYADIISVLQVTLDGPRDIHNSRRMRLGGQGTFDEIVAGIDLLLSLGIDVDLRVNVDAENISSLHEFSGFVIEKGWNQNQHLRVRLAPVVLHASSGCSASYQHAMTELEMLSAVLRMMDADERVREVCDLSFSRHLEHLVSVLEPQRMSRPRRGEENLGGPRFWYCESPTGRQVVFTPDGLVYSCTEALGKPQHAIGRFDPEFNLDKNLSAGWIGRTILSHPKCRACPISTLCGGGCTFAARERVAASTRGLIQISVGRAAQPSASIAGLTSNSLASREPEPFCAAAETLVRQYLEQVGQRLYATAQTV